MKNIAKSNISTFSKKSFPHDDHFYTSNEMCMEILNTLPDHIAVIDHHGDIVFVNRKWEQFGKQNGYSNINHTALNYLETCEESAKNGDEYAKVAIQGIRQVLQGKLSYFDMEYPCHSPNEQRWFTMIASTLKTSDNKPHVLITHQNISKIAHLAQTDSLVELPNRRAFDNFLYNQWKHCRREQKYMALAMIDIDNFKSINDTYGHAVGDACLKVIGKILKQHCQRSSDICARLGGDEFAVAWSDSPIGVSQKLAIAILDNIREASIQTTKSSQAQLLSASIGVTALIPNMFTTEKHLINAADALLYQAKLNGRNTVASE